VCRLGTSAHRFIGGFLGWGPWRFESLPDSPETLIMAHKNTYANHLVVPIGTFSPWYMRIGGFVSSEGHLERGNQPERATFNDTSIARVSILINEALITQDPIECDFSPVTHAAGH
jgi:hypothetical protein